MTRCGLREPSFEKAAEGFEDAIGESVSGASVRRVTQGFGRQLQEQQEQEAARAEEIGPHEEFPQERWIDFWERITGVGNVSSDGTMILLREEGWKEVKVTVFSEVTTLPPHHPDRRKAQREGRQRKRDVVRLSNHSYYASLREVDLFTPYQYAEGLRRGFDLLTQASSVNDGARWIARMTDTNFPHAQQVIDWSHSTEHLWAVGNAVFGEDTPEAGSWVSQREAELWEGEVEEVVATLQSLNLADSSYPDVVQQAPGYFYNRIDKMQYAHFRNLGFPIGSGTVESAACNVVQPRMRRPGQGWKRDNAEAMLSALGEFHSGRLRWAWRRVYSTPN